MSKVILEIRDEVNVKFVGLDVRTRRKISDAVKYFLPYAYHTPAYKLGRWDGCVRFCDVGGRTYFNLLEKLLPLVVEEGYEVQVDDQRQSWNFSFSPVGQTDYDHIAWPAKHPRAGDPIILRDYQVEVINRFLDNLQCLQEIATGAGKTLITAALSHKCEPYGRTIVIVPNKDLVVQTERDYVNLGLDVGVFFGDRKEFGKTHTICTWQSLAILEKKTKEGVADIDVEQFLDGVVCVMVDECFSPGTKVLTPSGYVDIESLKSGDTVINFCESTKQFKADTVVKLHKNLPKSNSEKMYELEFDTGSKIKVTGNHKFLTQRGWVRADELTEHDEIVSLDKNKIRKIQVKLTRRTEIQKSDVTYNLHVQHDHNYIVEGAVVQNCHKAKADVMRDQLSGIFRNVPIRWGLTGTIPKDEYEAVACTCALGPVVGNLSSKELQDIGVLADLDINILQLQDGVLGFNSYAQELKWLLTDPTRVDHISSIINGLAASGNTLVLIDRIKTGEMLLERNPNWAFISGEMKTTDRQKEYAEISDMNNKVIVATYGVAAVGINIPRIFNLVMIEPGKSFVRVIQSIGRGIRKAEDKNYVQVVDITSNLKYSKRHLIKRKQFYAEQNFRHSVTRVQYK